MAGYAASHDVDIDAQPYSSETGIRRDSVIADRLAIKKQAKILIVDDDETNLDLLESVLEDAGYQHIHLISDSMTTIKAYHDIRPDLILLDVRMPVLDGHGVMRALKALNDPLLPPVLFLTAEPSDENMRLAFEGGARDFIGKPFKIDEVCMRVANFLDVHFAHKILYAQRDTLEQSVRARTEALIRSQRQAVRHLSIAAEYRDEATGNHIIRMSRMSAHIARALGWDEDECELLLNASQMHDVGKIGVSDTILLKPGPLTDEEWVAMQSHTEIGARILADEDSPLMQMAADIAAAHHEKWDGSGYPRGLSGEAIPLAARIATIADVYDALSSVRPYKDAWPRDKALAQIRDGSGTHFDPALVEVFFAEIDALDAIRAEAS